MWRSYRSTSLSWNRPRGVTRLDGSRSRNKFGAHLFKPEIFWKQIEKCTCDIAGTLRRHAQSFGRVDWRVSFQRSVIACQAQETFLFSIFPWEGDELCFYCKTCDVLFVYKMCSTCCHFTTTEFWITSEPAFRCLSKGLQMHRSVPELSFLKIKWNVSLWPKQHDIASRHAVHRPQYISWFDISDNWRKFMNHWRQENAAKFAAQRSGTRWGSRAGGVELLCVGNTSEPSTQTAERKALHALWFLLYGTFQRCYYVKEVCLQALWLCVQVLRPVALVKEGNSTLVCQKTLLLLCKRCVNSKQALPLLHVWNQFIFPFLIDSVQQIGRYYREEICPVWAKHTLCTRIHKNIIKITNFRVST